MTADEFDAFLEKRAQRVSKRGPGTGLALSLMLFMAVHAVFMSVIPIVTDELRTGFSLSGSQIGLLTSSFMMAFAVGSIPMGILGSRWGGRVLLGGTVVMALGAVLFAFSASYPWFLASRFLQGIGASTTLPVVNMLIAQAFPPEKRARSLGLFGAGLGLGVVVGVVQLPQPGRARRLPPGLPRGRRGGARRGLGQSRPESGPPPSTRGRAAVVLGAHAPLGPDGPQPPSAPPGGGEHRSFRDHRGTDRLDALVPA